MPAHHRPAPFAPRRAPAVTESIGLIVLAIVGPLAGAFALLLIAALVLLTGCSSPDELPSAVSSDAHIAAARCARASVRPRIVGGVPDDDCEATSGVVFVKSLFGACSGVLVSPHIVLTARHCIAPTEKSLTGGVNCGALVTDHAKVAAAVAPELVTIATDGSPNARRFAVKEVRTPADDVLCDSDLAIVVLAEPATGIEPVAIRLHSRAEGDEHLRVVGFGKRDDGSSGERYRNDDVMVRRVGPDAASPRLGAHEFETGAGFCQGDSGGPAIDQKTDAVVGIVSRNQGCTADRGYVYTELAGFRTDLENAFASVGESPALEASRSRASQNLTYALGNECTTSADCDTQYCAASTERQFCTRSCGHGVGAACPTGWSCSFGRASAVCAPTTAKSVRVIPALRPDSHALDDAGSASPGCAASPRSPARSSLAFAAMALAMAALVARARSRA